MQTSTGQMFSIDDPFISKIPKDDLVMVEGSPEAIERLSRNVRLGVQEAERREKRRKQQRQSRKKNR